MQPRFYEMMLMTKLLGGKVEAELPSNKQIHSSRLFNRRFQRARIFMSLADRLRLAA